MPSTYDALTAHESRISRLEETSTKEVSRGGVLHAKVEDLGSKLDSIARQLTENITRIEMQTSAVHGAVRVFERFREQTTERVAAIEQTGVRIKHAIWGAAGALIVAALTAVGTGAGSKISNALFRAPLAQAQAAQVKP